MKRLVIPDGGRTGAFIVTENGVRSVQPFSAEILHLLKAAASLVRASSVSTDAKDSRSIARHSTTIANLAVQQIEQAIGPLDAESSLNRQVGDGCL